MNTQPSKRELRHFLKRYVPQPTAASNVDLGLKNRPYANSIPSPKDYVDNLLMPSYNQIALTKVEGPFEKSGWLAVGSTLYKLQKLGLTSIVVTDNLTWSNEKSSSELCKAMIRESMALIEAIEKAGGRARPIYGCVTEQESASSVEVNFSFIQSALDSHHIPIIIPIVSQPTGMQRPMSANDTMIALTQNLVKDAHHQMTPAKIVVINNEGGIPNHERPGTAHSLVNIQEEYDTIVDAFQRKPAWQQSNPTALSNLAMIRSCLTHLPTSSSAIIVPTVSLPSALIANLVTDKPLYSSSLPIHNLQQGSPDLERVNQSRTTVLRHGIKINTYDKLSQLDTDRLTRLLEASFQRKLDGNAFYGRLERVLAGAIVAGDYEGAVIMTNEDAENVSRSHVYLDKFAIAPTSQGIGLTDILWRRMCDAYPEILWRSRKDNGVNKWYFERSNGYIRLKDTNWVVFWHGENGYKNMKDYAHIARSIPASFST
ncbi:uncharacterized protein BYT42DRAFT_488260 [Radiomyces spectabilis]|uniref:uncharacterized protein n=1 Tax=Radiomyces spectabilis TaxID=64574 RepID=UPI002220235B|nr:uncharacterized protein BYT42DRAFT_488260 [Radiomyces spectabilis]KAI8393990.1 hypothetical protein BYT42DRAFT_488260 [Radiomyces spectabilis]